MKSFIRLGTIAAVLALVSCSSKDNFEADVRKMAQYSCEIQKLMGQGGVTEETEQKLLKVQADMEAFSKELDEKYGDVDSQPEKQAIATKILQEEMAKCK